MSQTPHFMYPMYSPSLGLVLQTREQSRGNCAAEPRNISIEGTHRPCLHTYLPATSSLHTTYIRTGVLLSVALTPPPFATATATSIARVAASPALPVDIVALLSRSDLALRAQAVPDTSLGPPWRR